MNAAEVRAALNDQAQRIRQLEEQVEQLFELSNRHTEATNRALRQILSIIRDMHQE